VADALYSFDTNIEDVLARIRRGLADIASASKRDISGNGGGQSQLTNVDKFVQDANRAAEKLAQGQAKVVEAFKKNALGANAKGVPNTLAEELQKQYSQYERAVGQAASRRQIKLPVALEFRETQIKEFLGNARKVINAANAAGLPNVGGSTGRAGKETSKASTYGDPKYYTSRVVRAEKDTFVSAYNNDTGNARDLARSRRNQSIAADRSATAATQAATADEQNARDAQQASQQLRNARRQQLAPQRTPLRDIYANASTTLDPLISRDQANRAANREKAVADGPNFVQTVGETAASITRGLDPDNDAHQVGARIKAIVDAAGIVQKRFEALGRDVNEIKPDEIIAQFLRGRYGANSLNAGAPRQAGYQEGVFPFGATRPGATASNLVDTRFGSNDVYSKTTAGNLPLDTKSENEIRANERRAGELGSDVDKANEAIQKAFASIDKFIATEERQKTTNSLTAGASNNAKYGPGVYELPGNRAVDTRGDQSVYYQRATDGLLDEITERTKVIDAQRVYGAQLNDSTNKERIRQTAETRLQNSSFLRQGAAEDQAFAPKVRDLGGGYVVDERLLNSDVDEFYKSAGQGFDKLGVDSAQRALALGRQLKANDDAEAADLAKTNATRLTDTRRANNLVREATQYSTSGISVVEDGVQQFYKKVAEGLRKVEPDSYEYLQEQSAYARSGKGRGFLGGVAHGLTSGGIGGNGSDGLTGIGTAIGTTAKYSALYDVLGAIESLIGRLGTEMVNFADSNVNLGLAIDAVTDSTGKATTVSQDYINTLEQVSIAAGSNVGDIEDVVASGIRSIGINSSYSKKELQGLGAEFGRQAQTMAVLAKTSITDAAGNLRAIGSAYNVPLQNTSRVNDALVIGKRVGGGDEKETAQAVATAGASLAQAGFSLEQSFTLASRIQAATDETGAAVGNKLSRIIAIVQGSAGSNAISAFNASLTPEQVKAGGGKVNQDATPQQQIYQLSKLYESGTLTQSQIGPLVNSLFGTSSSKEGIVALEDYAKLSDQLGSGMSDAGAAAKELQERMKDLSQTVRDFQGSISALLVNLGNSHFLDPVIVGFKILVESIRGIAAAVGAFDQLSHGIGRVVAYTGELAVFVALLRKIKAAGQESGDGIYGTLERRYAPKRYLARQQIQDRKASTTSVEEDVAGRQGKPEPVIQRPSSAPRTRPEPVAPVPARKGRVPGLAPDPRNGSYDPSTTRYTLPNGEVVTKEEYERRRHTPIASASKPLSLYHGGLPTGTTIDDIDLDRQGSQQNKRGRDYGGFYANDEQNRAQAENYAAQRGGVLHQFDLKPDARIGDLGEKNIERLTKAQRDEYAKQFDVIKGKNTFGKTEHVLLNKDSVASVIEHNVLAAQGEAAQAAQGKVEAAASSAAEQTAAGVAAQAASKIEPAPARLGSGGLADAIIAAKADGAAAASKNAEAAAQSVAEGVGAEVTGTIDLAPSPTRAGGLAEAIATAKRHAAEAVIKDAALAADAAAAEVGAEATTGQVQGLYASNVTPKLVTIAAAREAAAHDAAGSVISSAQRAAEATAGEIAAIPLTVVSATEAYKSDFSYKAKILAAEAEAAKIARAKVEAAAVAGARAGVTEAAALPNGGALGAAGRGGKGGLVGGLVAEGEGAVAGGAETGLIGKLFAGGTKATLGRFAGAAFGPEGLIVGIAATAIAGKIKSAADKVGDAMSGATSALGDFQNTVLDVNTNVTESDADKIEKLKNSASGSATAADRLEDARGGVGRLFRSSKNEKQIEALRAAEASASDQADALTNSTIAQGRAMQGLTSFGDPATRTLDDITTALANLNNEGKSTPQAMATYIKELGLNPDGTIPGSKKKNASAGAGDASTSDDGSTTPSLSPAARAAAATKAANAAVAGLGALGKDYTGKVTIAHAVGPDNPRYSSGRLPNNYDQTGLYGKPASLFDGSPRIIDEKVANPFSTYFTKNAGKLNTIATDAIGKVGKNGILTDKQINAAGDAIEKAVAADATAVYKTLSPKDQKNPDNNPAAIAKRARDRFVAGLKGQNVTNAAASGQGADPLLGTQDVGVSQTNVEGQLKIYDAEKSILANNPDALIKAGQRTINVIKSEIARTKPGENTAYLYELLTSTEQDVAEQQVSQGELILKAQQKNAKTSAEIRALGDAFFTKYAVILAKAGDVTGLISLMDMANTDEINTVKGILDAKIAKDKKAADDEKKLNAAIAAADKAFGGSEGDGSRLNPNYGKEGSGLGVVAPGTDPSLAGTKPSTKAQDKYTADKDAKKAFDAALSASTPDQNGGGELATGVAADDDPTATAIAIRNQNALGAAKLDAANRAVRDARQVVKAGAKTALEAAQNQKALNDALYDQGQAQLDYAKTAAQLKIDFTDPVAAARQTLKDSQAAYQQAIKDANSHNLKGRVREDFLNPFVLSERQNQVALENTTQTTYLSDLQTSLQVGRISHTRYLELLKSRRDQLLVEYKGMVNNEAGRKQLQGIIDSYTSAIKSEADSLSGQFNLGDITVPTVYQVRRSLKQSNAGTILGANAALSAAGNVTNDNSTRNIIMNGVSLEQVLAVLKDQFGVKTRTTASRRIKSA
jgi:hypothetical protein